MDGHRVNSYHEIEEVVMQSGPVMGYNKSLQNISLLTPQSTMHTTEPTTQAAATQHVTNSTIPPTSKPSTQSMTLPVTSEPLVLQKLKDLYKSDMMVGQGIKMKWIISRMIA